ncbi:hypothetical protein PCANC_16629 [Puccinia coronata f. sp. avenae]|uniref:SMP-LTD domain-containing protein n=1 Tax=Puccinia coronata f. sp. avenae TaxID=200324 RepID=A0A2N5T3S2_9BASI|nr:hypothetical protein PCANC_16629 [Puccinia coronata f. sp. avenae]PLW34921.1 hypothetical protein PCASD_14751 [Puccinia coronata f. sp. avenae]
MFYLLLSVYVLGGLTFLPLVLVSAAGVLFYLSPTQTQPGSTKTTGHGQPPHSAGATPISPNHSQQDQAKNEADAELPKLYRAGWLTVRQTYQPSQNSESSYMGLITNSYRNFMDQRSKDSKRARPKDQFYTVLKQNVLFLYQDENQIDCAAAIQVSLYHVDLYPSGSPDGELFVKRKAICLKPIIQNSSTPSPIISHHSKHSQPSEKLENSSDHQFNHQPGRPAAWFIFTKNNLEKEDWYHILLASSKLNGSSSKTTFQKDASLFHSEDMAKLVDGIDQQPDPIPMRWMNAMLGRLFLSTYRTHAFEHWIIDRIMKKLAKVQTPSFLSAINVREVNVGSTTPFFSKPMLKELTIDGDASMEVLVTYKGEFRITIETVATFNLGARFKPYAVNLVLAVVLKELSGTLLLKIKRPPTNRLWFGFTAMPHLVLDLEPVVSTRQIKWALVLKPIESRIREVIMESIVYPNLDDLVFFDTQSYTHQGGIWGDAARKENSADDASEDQGSDESVGTEDGKSNTQEPSLTHKKSLSEPHYQPASQATKAPLSTAREDSHLSHDTIRQRTAKKNANESVNSSGVAVPSQTDDEAIQSSPTPPHHPPENKRSSWFSTTRRQDTASTQASQASTSSRNQTKNRLSHQQSSDLDDGDAVTKLQKFLRSHPEGSNSCPSTPNLDAKPTPNPIANPLPRVAEPVEIEFAHSSSPANLSTTLPEGLPQTPAQPISISSSQPAEDLSQQENPGSVLLAQTLSTHSSEQPSPPLRRLPPPPRQTLPTTFLPPPTRTNAAGRSSLNPANASTNASSSSSILNQLRTRATDKEAIAASVTQARDVVIKWGAAWASKRKSPQANHGYPYNSGFNPISIEQAQDSSDDKNSVETHSNSLSSLTEPVDMDISLITDTGNESSSPENEPQDDEPQKSKSYRAHRLRVGMGKANSMDPTSPPSNPHQSGSASPLPDSLSTSSTGNELQPQLSSTKLVSLSPASNVDEASSLGKRNRIFSSKGQFIPAAPQSTTGLSICSTQPEGLSNHSESPLPLPLDDLPTGTMKMTATTDHPSSANATLAGTTSTPKSAGRIHSERSSYKPAPMMMVPGIKDSSHRFALGSDSLSAVPQHTSDQPDHGTAAVVGNESTLGLDLVHTRLESPSAPPGHLGSHSTLDGNAPIQLKSKSAQMQNEKDGDAIDVLDSVGPKEDKVDGCAPVVPLTDPLPSSSSTDSPQPSEIDPDPPAAPRPASPTDTPLNGNTHPQKLVPHNDHPLSQELNPDSLSPLDDAWGL